MIIKFSAHCFTDIALFQNKQCVPHWQGKQAMGDTAKGQGYQAFHCRGERQEAAVEAVDDGCYYALWILYRSSGDSRIKLSVNPSSLCSNLCQ